MHISVSQACYSTVMSVPAPPGSHLGISGDLSVDMFSDQCRNANVHATKRSKEPYRKHVPVFLPTQALGLREIRVASAEDYAPHIHILPR